MIGTKVVSTQGESLGEINEVVVAPVTVRGSGQQPVVSIDSDRFRGQMRFISMTTRTYRGPG